MDYAGLEPVPDPIMLAFLRCTYLRIAAPEPFLPRLHILGCGAWQMLAGLESDSQRPGSSSRQRCHEPRFHLA